MAEEKHFDEWNNVKKIRHDSGRSPVIKEGEIWWCAMGDTTKGDFAKVKGGFGKLYLGT